MDVQSIPLFVVLNLRGSHSSVMCGRRNVAYNNNISITNKF